MTEILVPDYDDLITNSYELSSPTQVNRSTWSGRRKVVGLAGTETWRANVSIDIQVTEMDERPWRAFLFGLKSPANWFKFYLPRASHIGPRPLVAAGASDGNTLPLDGMQPNTIILEAGQFMTVPLPSGHFRAVMLTADLKTNGAGDAIATFEPSLNETPDENTQIETVRAFIPVSPAESVMRIVTSNGIAGATFDVEESL